MARKYPTKFFKLFYYGALVLALLFLSPPKIAAQDMSAGIVGGRWWTDYGYPEYFTYWVYNGDGEVALKGVSLSLGFQPQYGWVFPPAGWDVFIFENNTVIFTAQEGREIQPGGGEWIVVYGPGLNDAEIDYEIVGIYSSAVLDQGKATSGKTTGSAGY